MLYQKVEEGLLDHRQFQDEARALLAPYEFLANKLAEKNVYPFRVVVQFDQSGQISLLQVLYDSILGSELTVMCKTTFGGN